jgi:hypothetical protein
MQISRHIIGFVEKSKALVKIEVREGDVPTDAKVAFGTGVSADVFTSSSRYVKNNLTTCISNADMKVVSLIIRHNNILDLLQKTR